MQSIIKQDSKYLPLPAKSTFKMIFDSPSNALKIQIQGPETLIYLKRQIICIQMPLYRTTENCPYGLNLSLQQLLTGKPAKHVQLIILFIHLERRKKGTYTELYVRLRGQCWYHYMLAFPVPGPASFAMQIGTCKTKVNKELHKAGGKEGKVSQLWLWLHIPFKSWNLQKWSELP